MILYSGRFDLNYNCRKIFNNYFREFYDDTPDYIKDLAAQIVAHQVREWLDVEARGYDLNIRDDDDESGAFSFSLPKFTLPKITLPNPKTIQQIGQAAEAFTNVGTGIAQ